MGEADPTRSGFSSNRSLEFDRRPERLPADADALALRELDEQVGFPRGIAAALHDPRRQELMTHRLAELFRSRHHAMAQGQRDQDDLDRLRDDPAFRLQAAERRGDAPLLPVPTPSAPPPRRHLSGPDERVSETKRSYDGGSAAWMGALARLMRPLSSQSSASATSGSRASAAHRRRSPRGRSAQPRGSHRLTARCIPSRPRNARARTRWTRSPQAQRPPITRSPAISPVARSGAHTTSS